MNKNIFMTIGGLCLFLLGMATGVLITQPKSSDEKSQFQFTEIHNKGRLTSPLIECDIPSSSGKTEFNAFEQKLRENINSIKIDGSVTHVSVYFRELLDGSWIGIDETEQFTPASLLKVPNMIALLKLEESDPAIAQKQFLYDKTYVTGDPAYYPSEKTLTLQSSYSVGNLIEYMVQYSDNEAMYLLRENFPSAIFNKLYTDLGIATPDDTISDDFMNVKSYASFFRILYNASYLSQAMSEKALSILTETTFTQGLVSGVPKDTIVAHKFGERLYTDDNSKQLHDCGIIYHPKEPYLLCVMTRGKDFNELADVIKSISTSVWSEIESRNPSPTTQQ